MLKEIGLAALVALVVLVGVQLFLPIQIAYATSDSMAPIIDEGDAYLVEETSSIDRGDIVTFYSAEQDTHVTHRVVDRTDAGFITKGDANPSTDQAAGTPPVPSSAIIGEVVLIHGQPLTVPGIGPILALLDSHRMLVLTAAAAIITLDLATSISSSTGPKPRDQYRVGDFVQPLLIGSFILCLALVSTAGTVHDVTYIASTEETGAPQTVPVGESVTRTVTIETRSSPLSTVYLDVEGIEIVEQTRSGSTLHLTVRVPAQDTVGPYRASIGTYSYPKTLPKGLLATLHEIHWAVAAVGSLIPVFGPIALVYALLYDSKAPIRVRPRRRGKVFGRR